MFKPELIKGGQDSPMSETENFQTRVLEQSEITETKIFSKGEILGLIEQISKQEDIQSSELEITDEAYDQEGNLIVLSVRVIPDKAKGQGWTSIEYTFMIKGKHGAEGFGEESNICRIVNIDKPEESQGGIVATYDNDKWELDPGNISPRTDDIKIDE